MNYSSLKTKAHFFKQLEMVFLDKPYVPLS